MSELREHTEQPDERAVKRDEQDSGRDQDAGRSQSSPSSAFITLDDGARKNAPAARRRTVVAALGAVACLALIVVCLGFVHPSETGGWSIAWLFQTTEEAQVAEEPAGGSAASAQDAESSVSSSAGSQDQTGAADATTEGDGADATAPEGADASTSSNGGAGASGDSSSSSSSGAGTSSNGGSSHGGASSGEDAQGGASSSNPGGAGAAEQPQTVTISVSVDSSSVGSPVSASGTYTFEKGATAYDALCALGISVNASGSQFGVYVSAIGGLAEKEHGATSGWLYTVNGAQPTSAASSYVLSDGDAVCWVYSVSE